MSGQVGLTSRQAQCMAAIRARIAVDGVAPSFRELAAALGLKSISGIHRLLTGLEERGYIRCYPRGVRTIAIVEPQDSRILTAARRVVESIVSEDEEAGTVVVKADAIGELDIVLAEEFL